MTRYIVNKEKEKKMKAKDRKKYETMTAKEKRELLKQWRIRKACIYLLATIAIVAGAILFVQGFTTSPIEHSWKMICGIFLMLVGMFLFPDMWNERFKDYLRKKGL